MFDDLSKSIKAQLYERVSSPLLGSFAISWVAWNYRFVLTLISSLPLNEKLAFIDTHIFPSYTQVLLQGGLYPLGTALLLIFVYPIPAKFVYAYWKKRQRDLKEVQQKIDDETPLSREEARQIRREALQTALEYDKEIESKSVEIARLKDLIDGLQQADDAKPAVQVKTEPVLPTQAYEIDDAQAAMLDEVARASDGIAKQILLGRTPGDKVVAEYNLGELHQRDLVTMTYRTGSRDYLVKATHAGRAQLVKREKLGDALLQ